MSLVLVAPGLETSRVTAGWKTCRALRRGEAILRQRTESKQAEMAVPLKLFSWEHVV